MLFHPAYLPDIRFFAQLAQAENVLWEKHDHYQKQSFRTRTYIYGANGKLQLTIPIKHSGGKKEHQRYDEILTDTSSHWHMTHWKSIVSAYRSSPYFEFYEDEFVDIFKNPPQRLYDFNMQLIQIISDCIGIAYKTAVTSAFAKATDQPDARMLIQAKKLKSYNNETYTQVFHEKYGFIENLSVIDLLFNLGPESLGYLKRQPVVIEELRN